MLITPERSHRQPASAPSTSGIDASKVPCSRLMMLNGMPCPACAQHSSASTKANSTTPMPARRSTGPAGRSALLTPMASETAPHT